MGDLAWEQVGALHFQLCRISGCDRQSIESPVASCDVYCIPQAYIYSLGICWTFYI
jgi:hypothetical protein